MIFAQFSCGFWLVERDWDLHTGMFVLLVSLVLLCVVFNMDAVIRQAVRDELRRQSQTESDTGNQNVESTASTSSNQRTERTERRLSGLLDRIRKQPKGKKRKIRDKENRIQMRWIHFNDRSKVFVPVRQRNGGGNRFISYNALEPPTVDEIKQKARALFFPDGKSAFAGPVDDMLLDVCDTTQTVIVEFPGDGTIESYLKENGLYPSTTYLYLRSQHKDTLFREDENETGSPEQPVRLNTSQIASGRRNYIVCPVCSCTVEDEGDCLRCEQDREYECSLIADGGSTTDNAVALTLDELRSRRVAVLSNPDSVEREAVSEGDMAEGVTHHAQATGDQASPPAPSSGNQASYPDSDVFGRLLTVHRSCIRTDLIEHFKDPTVMNCNVDFKIINERGQLEPGAGVGVICEVYSLFWKEFSIAMTIGERERVPFVRHDYFVEEWEAVGRILVKGYMSISYFPTFLSKAFLCYCLFGNQVPDAIFLDSFTKYLSLVEEELIVDIIRKTQLPDDEDEFTDFLDRFQCRRVVSNENVNKIILEISKQELIQKPHLMIASLQPFVQQLKQYPQFQSISSVECLYDTLKPTTKKVLSSFVSNPESEGERDAFKFLQRFVRGLDMSKLERFLRFTTGMDILVGKNIEVTFIKCEGLGVRPIAHTCGPVLEIPSTYSNYVEFREDFTNILSRDTWEMDII